MSDVAYSVVDVQPVAVVDGGPHIRDGYEEEHRQHGRRKRHLVPVLRTGF